MKTVAKTLIVAAIGMSLGGCSAKFLMRSSEDYQKASRDMVSSKKGEIQACFDAALAGDPNLAGDVVVNFKIAKKTGEVSDATVVKERTTAPDALADCVVGALNGLKLAEPDACNADATHTWRFVAG